MLFRSFFIVNYEVIMELFIFRGREREREIALSININLFHNKFTYC